MGIVKGFSSKMKDFLRKPADVLDDEDYIDDEYMDSDEFDEYGDAPKYTPYGEDSHYADEADYEYEEPKKEAKRKPSKSGANIYNMNSAPKYSSPKYRLVFFALNDMYDAKNVADKIVDKNTIVLISLAKLSDDQRVRAMDFLDGAKYVAKCIYSQLTEDIYAYIPGEIELEGDFLDQVDF